MTSELVNQICRFAGDAPPDLVQTVTSVMQDLGHEDWPYARSRILHAVPYSAAKRELTGLLDYWQARHSSTFPLSALALAILAADAADQRQRDQERVELVWTGPSAAQVPMRRIDQALLEVIQSARRSLHIVSFAAYRVPTLVDAMIDAAQRGVQVRLYLETPDASSNKIAYNTIAVLGDELPKHVRVFTWPLDKRPTSPDGKHGSLHAKLAVADSRNLLVSSANLTEYALTLNIEAGVMVTGGDTPRRVEEQLNRLLDTGVFQPLSRN